MMYVIVWVNCVARREIGRVKMDFHVQNTSIKNILSEDRVYMIPRFQRDYSWEEEQCETF